MYNDSFILIEKYLQKNELSLQYLGNMQVTWATGLTDIKLKALLSECVTASSCPAVLLQNQNFLPNFSKEHGQSEPTDPTADDDSIQVLRYFTGHKT